MKINADRMMRDIETLAAFTATPGQGVTRHCFTPEDRQARAYIRDELLKLNATVWEDGYANLFGRLEGRDPGAPPVIIGSHYDSVTHGGRFDGTFGVVAALEILRVIREQGLPHRHPIELVAMNDEEGVRFGTGISNSRAMAGVMADGELDLLKDKDGVSLRQALIDFGMAPDLTRSRRAKGSVKAYIEIHIEQGPVLENGGCDIGLVQTIVGLDRYEVTVRGKAGHAGTTPMDSRRDALVAAAEYICAVNAAAREVGHGTVGTVGEIAVSPGAGNVIPGLAVLCLDVRSTRESHIQAVMQKLGEAAKRIEAGRNVTIETARKLYIAPVDMFEGTLAVMEKLCGELGFRGLKMNSGAGHDAMIMAQITDSNLIFVPSKDGLSHHPDEWTDKGQLQKGAELMLQTVLQVANP